MNKVILSLGTNLGDRELNLQCAIKSIMDNIGFDVNLSHIYETEPWGFECNESFLNMVLSVNTNLDPEHLLKMCMKIEKEMGRKRTGSGGYEARIIDIDILFYEDLVISKKGLIIPHPYIQMRRFILEPLTELASDFVHPVLNKKISELNSECNDKGVVRIFTSEKTQFILSLQPEKGNRCKEIL